MNNAILTAINNNNTKRLKTLLKEQTIIYDDEIFDDSFISISDKLGHMECVRLLLVHGHDPRWNDYMDLSYQCLTVLVECGDEPRSWDRCQVNRDIKFKFCDYQDEIKRIRDVINTIRMIKIFRPDNILSIFPLEIIEIIAEKIWIDRKEYLPGA